MRVALATLVAVAVVGLAAIAGSGPASGDGADLLQVYSARGTASAVGLVLRVPAESSGGVPYAETNLELEKARALAAGATPGSLAEAFLATTVEGLTNPTLAAAQSPPSPVFPAEKTAGAPASGPLKAASFVARTSAAPTADAEAVGGQFEVNPLVRVGGATARSTGEILPDGTVVSVSTSAVTDVVLGPPGVPLVSIGSLRSVAEVRTPPEGQPATHLKVASAGVLVAGVPVELTQDGLRVAGGLPVPAPQVAVVNQALRQLGQLGITLEVVPVVTNSEQGSASVAGAALAIRSIVPPEVELPTDIGKDNTILLGQVSASAVARPRRPFTLPTLPTATEPPAPLPPLAAVEPPTGGTPITALLPSRPSAAAPRAATRTPTEPGFALPIRNRASDTFSDVYRWFLFASAVAVGVFVARRRTRLSD